MYLLINSLLMALKKIKKHKGKKNATDREAEVIDMQIRKSIYRYEKNVIFLC